MIDFQPGPILFISIGGMLLFFGFRNSMN